MKTYRWTALVRADIWIEVDADGNKREATQLIHAKAKALIPNATWLSMLTLDNKELVGDDPPLVSPTTAAQDTRETP